MANKFAAWVSTNPKSLPADFLAIFKRLSTTAIEERLKNVLQHKLRTRDIKLFKKPCEDMSEVYGKIGVALIHCIEHT